jgi:hypothetical protein
MTLDRAANVAVITVCLAVTGQVIVQVATRSGSRPARDVPSIYAAGEALPNTGLDTSAADYSLILVLNTACVHCAASMGFYRQLSLRLRDASRIRLAVIGVDPVERMAAYLQRHDVAADEVVKYPLRLLKVMGTPTIILVNKDAIVEEIWSGTLSPLAETNLVERLTQLASGLGSDPTR